MLCRRMNLNERHLQPPKIPSEGPIIRPCSNKKDSNSAPCSAHKHDKSDKTKLLETPTKTPLAIVDLNMSPEAKTMVQRDIKKDPKKPPPFCKQYTHGSRLSLFHDDSPRLNIVPQLLVKGIVFSSNGSCSNKNQENLQDDFDSDPNNNITPMPNHSLNDSGSISLSGSCESLADNSSITGRHHKNCMNTPLAVQEFILNLEQYGMDKDGRLPGLARATSPQFLGPLQVEHPPPSPTTRQIIRVDVTVNKDKMESERFRQINGNIGNSFTTRALLRDKRGRLKLNSSMKI